MAETTFPLREDCFGCRGGGCGVLSEALCVTTGRCAFFKTRAQARADTERVRAVAVERGWYATGDKYTPREWGRG